MSALVNKSTRGLCQGFTGSHGTVHAENVFAAYTLSDAALKTAKAVKA